MMKKQLPALLAALLMTGVITLVMVVTSANALLNQNTTTVAPSASTAPDAQTVVGGFVEPVERPVGLAVGYPGWFAGTAVHAADTAARVGHIQ